MIRRSYTTAICLTVTAVMLVVTVLFMYGEALGITVAHSEPPYAASLFSTDRVHTLDIVVDEEDWQGMLDNAQAKEYIMANVVIDGEAVNYVGLRTKGNSSLSSIATADSDRYSFKIEFDHYDGTQTYKGLDKLALNNITQDSTYLKDYLSYQLMGAFGADAPLCSFIYITVNGEEWGLYLAVEGIEESFASRNYGSDYGQIYKPDSMNMNGGGRGGDDEGGGMRQMFGGNGAQDGGEAQMPDFAAMFGDGEMPDMADMEALFQNGEMPNFTAMLEGGGTGAEVARGGNMGGGFGGFGQGNSDVRLVYTDDEYTSYSNIFDSAKFNPTDADKDRLIASLKQMNAGENLEEVVNIDEVLRYFVVHNFVLNFDSYTGSMVHNYYLYEEDGQLSMIAWDYNLGFGAFNMGGGGMRGGTGSGVDTATSTVNYPIDSPVSGGNMEDRPLLYQLLSNETYLARYHELFDEFISEVFESGAFAEAFDAVVALISPYVEKDPTAFCTYEEFLTAQAQLKELCLLRAQSVRGQLDGTISATSEGQAETNQAGFIDASHVDMNAMGSMGFGQARNRMGEGAQGGGFGGNFPFNGQTASTADMPQDIDMSAMPDMSAMGGEGMERPQMDMGAFPADMGGELPAMPEGTMPEGMAERTGNPDPPQDAAATGDAQPSPAPTEAAEPVPAQPTVAGEDSATAEQTDAPTQGRGNMGGGFAMPGWDTQQQTPQDNTQQYWLLGGSLVLLVAGLAFAAWYKRY